VSELKTKLTNQDPKDFLNTVEPDVKRADSFVLLEMFQKITGENPAMWGTSMIGYGMYHYKSERSRQEGDWPLVAFSPRKQNLTLYIMAGNNESSELLEKLGKYKKSGGCLYINKLSDIDQVVLTKLIKKSFEFMQQTNS
jgi:hypothetical protein